METEEKKSALSELFDSIKFWMESKQGKYSLDTYLDIVGEYADRLILKAKTEENLTYTGGECRVEQEAAQYHFHVKLYFQNNKDKSTVIKEGDRKLSKTKFISETELEVGNGKVFEIDNPE